MASFVLLGQNPVVVAETIWPTKSQIFIVISHHLEKDYWHLVYYNVTEITAISQVNHKEIEKKIRDISGIKKDAFSRLDT